MGVGFSKKTEIYRDLERQKQRERQRQTKKETERPRN